MNLPELCIRRPVMTTLLMAAFLIFGVIAYRALPVSELPKRRLPDHLGLRRAARRLAGNHGRRRRHAAGRSSSRPSPASTR